MACKGLIGIVGSGEEDPALEALSEEVGHLLGKKGMWIINGGLSGVMLGSARGAKRAGSIVVGLLPGLDPEDANPYVDISMPTGMGEMRNILIVRASAGLIAIGRGYGTLSEVAFALKTGKPVVGLKTWDVSKDLITAKDPEEAVSLLFKEINKV